jgi:hypothetical protein
MDATEQKQKNGWQKMAIEVRLSSFFRPSFFCLISDRIRQNS